MIAVGFFLLCVVALMMWLDRPIFGDNTAPWYATIGVFAMFGGSLSIAAGVAMILWRALP
jgi:hypothetical protein